MTTPTPTGGQVEAVANMFQPFQKWEDDGGIYGLCVDFQGNVIEPQEGQDYIEYRLCADGDDRWQLEVSDSAEACEVVYRGRIPSREFFVEIMGSIECAVVLQNTRATDAENAALREEVNRAKFALGKHLEKDVDIAKCILERIAEKDTELARLHEEARELNLRAEINQKGNVLAMEELARQAEAAEKDRDTLREERDEAQSAHNAACKTIGEIGDAAGWGNTTLSLPKFVAEMRDKITAQEAELARLREEKAVLQSQVDNADVNLEQVRLALKSRHEAELARLREENTNTRQVHAAYQELINKALTQIGAPTHHPNNGAERLKPMLPQERIQWIASELSTLRATNAGLVEVVDLSREFYTATVIRTGPDPTEDETWRFIQTRDEFRDALKSLNEATTPRQSRGVAALDAAKGAAGNERPKCERCNDTGLYTAFSANGGAIPDTDCNCGATDAAKGGENE